MASAHTSRPISAPVGKKQETDFKINQQATLYFSTIRNINKQEKNFGRAHTVERNKFLFRLQKHNKEVKVMQKDSVRKKSSGTKTTPAQSKKDRPTSAPQKMKPDMPDAEMLTNSLKQAGFPVNKYTKPILTSLAYLLIKEEYNEDFSIADADLEDLAVRSRKNKLLDKRNAMLNASALAAAAAQETKAEYSETVAVEEAETTKSRPPVVKAGKGKLTASLAANRAPPVKTGKTINRSPKTSDDEKSSSKMSLKTINKKDKPRASSSEKNLDLKLDNKKPSDSNKSPPRSPRLPSPRLTSPRQPFSSKSSIIRRNSFNDIPKPNQNRLKMRRGSDFSDASLCSTRSILKSDDGTPRGLNSERRDSIKKVTFIGKLLNGDSDDEDSFPTTLRQSSETVNIVYNS